MQGYIKVNDKIEMTQDGRFIVSFTYRDKVGEYQQQVIFKRLSPAEVYRERIKKQVIN